MYSRLTSNTTGLLGATRGLPGADVSPLGNASWSQHNPHTNFSIKSQKHMYWSKETIYMFLLIRGCRVDVCRQLSCSESLHLTPWSPVHEWRTLSLNANPENESFLNFIGSHLTCADPENVNLAFLQWTENIKSLRKRTRSCIRTMVYTQHIWVESLMVRLSSVLHEHQFWLHSELWLYICYKYFTPLC